MNKLLLFAFILCAAFSALAQHHEYSPLTEHEFKYKDWTYKSVTDGRDMNLRAALTGKKLVMVVYFAAWCPNWKNEAPFVEKLYEKYKANGFEVIGVAEYASLDDTKASLKTFSITFPVVIESDSRAMRDKTVHAEYRKDTKDARGWGSPWNIFIEPALVKKDGETLLTKASVVTGELIEADIEPWIRTKLGLGAEDKKTAAVADTKKTEVCEDKPLSDLVKP